MKPLLRTAVLLAISMGAFAATSAAFGSDEPRWKALDFKASKLFITLQTTVTVGSNPPPVKALIEPPAASLEGLKPLSAGLADRRVALETTVLGRRTLEEVHFNRQTGSAVQRYKRRFGSKSYSKTQRFLDGGVFLLRLAPEKGQSVDHENAWSRRGETLFQAPRGVRCPTVIDPIQIFYLLSTSNLKQAGDHFEVCVFSKHGYARLRAEATGTEKRSADYRIGGKPPADAEIETLRIALVPSHLKGSTTEEAFELMGLEGDVEIFLEKSLRVPVEIRGKHSKAGSVSIRLQNVRLHP